MEIVPNAGCALIESLSGPQRASVLIFLIKAGQTSGAKALSILVNHSEFQLQSPAKSHRVLSLCGKYGNLPTFDNGFANFIAQIIWRSWRGMVYRGNNTAVSPDFLSDLLQGGCGGIVDQSSMAGRGEEEAMPGFIQVRSVVSLP